MYTARILQVQTRNRKTNESLQWEVLPHISKLSPLGVSESYRFELYPLKLTLGKKKKLTLKYLYYIALKAVGP